MVSLLPFTFLENILQTIDIEEIKTCPKRVNNLINIIKRILGKRNFFIINDNHEIIYETDNGRFSESTTHLIKKIKQINNRTSKVPVILDKGRVWVRKIGSSIIAEFDNNDVLLDLSEIASFIWDNPTIMKVITVLQYSLTALVAYCYEMNLTNKTEIEAFVADIQLVLQNLPQINFQTLYSEYKAGTMPSTTQEQLNKLKTDIIYYHDIFNSKMKKFIHDNLEVIEKSNQEVIQEAYEKINQILISLQDSLNDIDMF